MTAFVEVKTAELIGAALDWAIGKFVGHVEIDDELGVVSDMSHNITGKWSPSTDWSQCGPLIEKYNIGLAPIVRGWGAGIDETDLAYGDCQCGETPLIAACRAIVAAKRGDTVSVPKELIP